MGDAFNASKIILMIMMQTDALRKKRILLNVAKVITIKQDIVLDVALSAENVIKMDYVIYAMTDTIQAFKKLMATVFPVLTTVKYAQICKAA